MRRWNGGVRDLSVDITQMFHLSLNFWLAKFGGEIWNRSGCCYPPRSLSFVGLIDMSALTVRIRKHVSKERPKVNVRNCFSSVKILVCISHVANWFFGFLLKLPGLWRFAMPYMQRLVWHNVVLQRKENGSKKKITEGEESKLWESNLY